MTKEKHPTRVFTILVLKILLPPNSLATINTKLVEGEYTVFQQILSAGVDWITPDILKFIAHKAKELINERKVRKKPAP